MMVPCRNLRNTWLINCPGRTWTERPCWHSAFQAQSQRGWPNLPEHTFFEGYISVMQQHLWLSPARWSKCGELWVEPRAKAAIKACGDGPSLPPVSLAAVSCHSCSAAAICSGKFMFRLSASNSAFWGRFVLCSSLVFCLSKGRCIRTLLS